MKEKVTHPFAPVCGENAEVLILGTFPSVKSRENDFYYGHPRNRVWPLLAEIFQTDVPRTIEEKTLFLRQNRVALWDVVAACEIEGSADSSIAEAKANDIPELLRKTKINRIICNGKKAGELFDRHFPEIANGGTIEVICCPSTSPANAAWTMEKLSLPWREALCCPKEEPTP